jgi:hypothetical protein
MIILFEANPALYSHPAVARPCFSAVKITPPESQRSSFRKMIETGAFSSID